MNMKNRKNIKERINMLKCGIIGFGGLGKIHFNNLSKMEERGYVKIEALCDINEKQFSVKTDTNLGSDRSSLDKTGYKLYTDHKKMLSDCSFDFIIVALPTFLHAPVSIDALKAGCHVFCEKPMAINAKQGQKMLETSKKQNRLLMIGHNLRFWPDYIKLKEFIDSGKYGKVIRAEFSRLSGTPKWGWENWFMNEERSGGAALDLHIHDVDAISWLFGVPEAVHSKATHIVTKFDSIITDYIYPDDKIITAVGDWGMMEKFPFRMTFSVRFEKATVEMDVEGFKIYTDGIVELMTFSEFDSYYDEIIHFIECINQNKPVSINPPEYSFKSLEITFAEKESAISGRSVKIKQNV